MSVSPEESTSIILLSISATEEMVRVCDPPLSTPPSEMLSVIVMLASTAVIVEAIGSYFR